jgi:uncharacterized protein (UPF0332 family)
MPPSIFDWEKLIDVAESLAETPDEPYLRAAIGRAYYYVFHLARKRLTTNQFHFIQGADSHKQVWEKFKNSPDARGQRLAAAGTLHKDKRTTADYNANYPRIGEDVPVLLEKAKQFAQQLSQLDPKLPRNTGIRV